MSKISKPKTTTACLELADISISLNGKTLVSISAKINGGEVLTIMGPSGSGKSTLLAFAGGFLDPVFEANGNILINQNDITHFPPQDRKLGLLFQDPLLFPHMSIGANLLFALPANIKHSVQRKQKVLQALDAADLSGYFERDPATLSGGQKSRIALLRVLLAEPVALLLDEPFSKLDASRRNTIREFVFTQAKQRGLPTLLVTHDRADAEAAKGKVFEL